MNMIHTCDSNKFTQQKQGDYYNYGTVQSYIKLFLMFPGINISFTAMYIYSWFKSKVSQNRGHVQTSLTTPLVMGLINGRYTCFDKSYAIA